MKPSGIGGQAVIEGVMMRNGGEYAVAVRTPEGQIVVDKQKCSSNKIQNKKFARLPIIRGVINFFDSMILGMKSLMYSASLFAEETEEEKAERERKARKKAAAKAEKLRAQGKTAEAEQVLKKCEEKLAKEAGQLHAEAEKEKQKKDDDVLMTLTVVFSLVVSIALFMMLPYFISRWMRTVIHSEILIVIAEGIVRLVIFFSYLALVSRMKDIQRTFMYHGAEHKCINCIEHGLELNVENVRKSSKEHKRCGTSFLMFVVIISVILFLFIRVDSHALRLVLRLALVPVIAGVSYELLRAAGRSDNPVINLISKPGLWMQGLTTKEPDDDMIEVGIASVEAVFDWRSYIAEIRAEEGISEAVNADTKSEDAEQKVQEKKP